MKSLSMAWANWRSMFVLGFLFTMPLLANLALWHLGVSPFRQKHHRIQEVARILEVRPALFTMSRESKDLIAQWEAKMFSEGSETAAIREIERMAEGSQIKIRQIENGRNSGQNTKPKGGGEIDFATMRIKVQAEGNYERLNQWLYALEGNPGIAVHEFSLGASKEVGRDVELTVSLELSMRKK